MQRNCGRDNDGKPFYMFTPPRRVFVALPEPSACFHVLNSVEDMSIKADINRAVRHLLPLLHDDIFLVVVNILLGAPFLVYVFQHIF